MAIIGKIREKSLLVLIVVGLGMLLFIIPFDQLLNSGAQADNSIGMFNGSSIDPLDWNFDGRVENLKAEYARNGQQLPDDYARQAVFNQMINDTLLNEELAKIGLITSDEELNAITWGSEGVPVSDYVQQMPFFQNAEQQFSKDSLNKTLRLILENNPSFWAARENEIARQNVINKYLSMITKGIIVTDNEAARDYHDEQDKASFAYAFKLYDDVPDSLVTVTDADIQAYYDLHKDDKKYDLDESRAFDFVSINIIPTAKDSAEVENRLAELKEEFAAARNDSMFVAGTADREPYSVNYIQPGVFPAAIDSLVQKAEKGDVIGPYLDAAAGSYKIAKVVESKVEPEAKVRHILLGFNGDNSDENKAKAKATADSVLRVLRQKNNFDELVALSDDIASVPNGGVYDWFVKGRMVPEFESFSFDKPIGSLDIVETTYGYHVVEVLDHRDAKRIAAPIIDKVIVPGDVTIKSFKDSAYSFVMDARDNGGLRAFAASKGIEVQSEENIVITNPYLENPELNNNFSILKWAFQSEVGDVADAVYLGNSFKLIVSELTQSVPEGVASFETAKSVMREEVMNEKKAEYLAAQVSGQSSLEEMSATWGVAVQQAPALSFKSNGVGGQADDNAIVGEVFNTAPGQMTKVLSGVNGAYVIQIKEFVPAPAVTDYSGNVAGLSSAIRDRANSDVMKALRDKAGVKDYRMKRQLMD